MNACRTYQLYSLRIKAAHKKVLSTENNLYFYYFPFLETLDRDMPPCLMESGIDQR